MKIQNKSEQEHGKKTVRNEDKQRDTEIDRVNEGEGETVENKCYRSQAKGKRK